LRKKLHLLLFSKYEKSLPEQELLPHHSLQLFKSTQISLVNIVPICVELYREILTLTLINHLSVKIMAHLDSPSKNSQYERLKDYYALDESK